jgi:peroxiredoxin
MILAAGTAAAILMAAVPSGPGVGEKVPDFQLTDQNGRQESLSSILGPKGALLVFYRSADW